MPKFQIELELSSINDRILLTNFDFSENSIGGLTFNENLSEEENGLYRLTFSLSEEIREYQDINFAKLIAIGRPLWLQLYEPRRSIRMVITSYSPVIGSENIIYEIEAQDYASYTFSRNNAGLTLDTIEDEEFLDWLRLYGKQDIVFLGSTTEEPDPTPTPTPAPTPSPTTTTTPDVFAGDVTNISVSFIITNKDDSITNISYKIREGSSNGLVVVEDTVSVDPLESLLVTAGESGQDPLKNSTTYFLTDVVAQIDGKSVSPSANPISLTTLIELAGLAPTEWILIDSSTSDFVPRDEMLIVGVANCVIEEQAKLLLEEAIDVTQKERGYVVRVRSFAGSNIFGCLDYYYQAAGPLKYNVLAKQFNTSIENLSVAFTVAGQNGNLIVTDTFKTVKADVTEGSTFILATSSDLVEFEGISYRFKRWHLNGVPQSLNITIVQGILTADTEVEVEYEINPFQQS